MTTTAILECTISATCVQSVCQPVSVVLLLLLLLPSDDNWIISLLRGHKPLLDQVSLEVDERHS